MKSFLIVSVLVAVGSLSLNAQEKVVLDTNPPPVAPKEEAIRTVNSAGVYYQTALDRTVARNKAIPLFRDSSGWGHLTASFVTKGNGIGTPDVITLSLFIASKDRTFVDNRSLSIKLDGKQLIKGQTELASGRTNGVEVYASLRTMVSVEEFKSLAKAKQVVLSVGPREFELTNQMTGGLRDLLSLIEDN